MPYTMTNYHADGTPIETVRVLKIEKAEKKYGKGRFVPGAMRLVLAGGHECIYKTIDMALKNMVKI